MLQKAIRVTSAPITQLVIFLLTLIHLSPEIERMNQLFRSRVKKIFILAVCFGTLVNLFFGWAALNHNPQNEFYTNDFITSDYFVLVLTTFGLVTSITLLVCLPIAYFFSRISNVP